MVALGAIRGGHIRNSVMEYIAAELERMEREGGLSNGLCANPNCRKPLPVDDTYRQSRGLKFVRFSARGDAQILGMTLV